MAALRLPSAPLFGAPERVSADDEDAAPPTAAFEPFADVPRLLWRSIPVPATPPTSVRLRTSIRAGS